MLQLIDNWRVAHKFTSMQLMAFAGVCDIILAGVVIVNQQFPLILCGTCWAAWR